MLVELEQSSAGRGDFLVEPGDHMKLFTSTDSEAVTEEITDIELETRPRNSLMSLLSGKQNQKRPRKTRKGKETSKQNSEIDSKRVTSDEAIGKITLHNEEIIGELPAKTFDNFESLTDEFSEVTDTSFDAAEFERRWQKQQTLADLELKVFVKGKSVSAKDLLTKPKTPVIVDVDEHVEEIVTTKLVEQPIPVEPITVEDDPVKLLETSLSYKRTAARDLFSSFAPKRVKNSKGEWTLRVKLRISPDKLAEIKAFENPLKVRGNTGTGKSLMSTLMRKTSLMVTLKLPPDFLKEIQKTSSPFYTKSSGNQHGKPAKSVFAMMMQTASQAALPKLTPIQKLKELWPPPIHRHSLHVLPPDDCQYSLEVLKQLPLKTKIQTCIPSDESMDSLLLLEDLKKEVQINSTISDIQDDIINIRAPLTSSSPAHKRIYDEFILHSLDKALNWPQKFQPPNLETLLLPKAASEFLKNWIENAFAILATQSTKTPRNIKLREQAKRKKREELFIVDDYYDEGEETEQDVFVPVLIISGETGSCKSSSVYAALNALDGYVHEINAGQQRSRKDLYGSLKEFCTTQLIHHLEQKTFQKGVVLFEDCDILFEQDKNFWSVVQDVTNFSKRPIVITVTEPGVIPHNIWDLATEQNSIIHLLNQDKDSLGQYLWLCAYSCGYDISTGVQDKVLDECKIHDNYDFRKALMACQWLCRGQPAPPGKVVKLTYNAPTQTEREHHLKDLAKDLDLLSIADVLNENTTSLLLHDSHANELLDVYVVHDTARQPSLLHEINIGDELQQLIDTDRPNCDSMLQNRFRQIVLDFISSRKKKLPRFAQEIQFLRTRSRSSPDYEEPIETQLLPDTSTCYSMSVTPFIVDLAPFARLWNRFQSVIISMDLKHQQEGKDIHVESYLLWRRFYHTSEIMDTLPM